jgi:hypothetical protein
MLLQVSVIKRFNRGRQPNPRCAKSVPVGFAHPVDFPRAVGAARRPTRSDCTSTTLYVVAPARVVAEAAVGVVVLPWISAPIGKPMVTWRVLATPAPTGRAARPPASGIQTYSGLDVDDRRIWTNAVDAVQRGHVNHHGAAVLRRVAVAASHARDHAARPGRSAPPRR